MTAFIRQWFPLTVLLFCSFVLAAQEYKYEIGGMIGGASYMGDANKNTLFKGINPSVGAVFRYNKNFRWAVKANLTWAKISGTTEGLDNVFPENAQAIFSRNVIDVGGQMEFNFFPYSDKYAYSQTKRLSPYVFIGLGATVSPGEGGTILSPNIPLGVGLKYKLRDRLNLGCEFSFRKLFTDRIDIGAESTLLDNPYGIDSSMLKNKDWYSFLHISVTWDFGRRLRPCNNIHAENNCY